MGMTGPFIFRYSGRFNWKRMYRDGRAFWVRKVATPLEFQETKYSHKPGKIVVRWEALHNYDAYYQIKYRVDFRLINPKTINVVENGQKVELLEASMYCWAWYELVEEYDFHMPGDETRIFRNDWLKSIFRKITWRDRWDLVDDLGLFACQDFVELLKKEVAMGAAAYSSATEPG